MRHLLPPLGLLIAIGLLWILAACGVVQADVLLPRMAGQIALVSNRDGSADIFLLDLAAGSLTNLTHTPDQAESDPAWSPDGRHILFTTPNRDPYTSYNLHIMNTDGSNRRRLSRGATPAWSPDGQRIYISTFSVAWPNQRGTTYLVGEIGSVDLTGADFQSLTGAITYEYAANQTSADSNPAISPDGKYVLYQHNYAGSISHVWRIDADGNNARRIDAALIDLYGGHASKDPAWSPDSSLIALFASEDIYQGTGMGLYIGDKNGEEWRLLESGFVGNPTWSPDARYIAYDAPYPQADTYAVMLKRADGEDAAQVLTPIDGHSYYAPAWRPCSAECP